MDSWSTRDIQRVSAFLRLVCGYANNCHALIPNTGIRTPKWPQLLPFASTQAVVVDTPKWQDQATSDMLYALR
jgi:hypothetical protein